MVLSEWKRRALAVTSAVVERNSPGIQSYVGPSPSPYCGQMNVAGNEYSTGDLPAAAHEGALLPQSRAYDAVVYLLDEKC